MIKKISVRKDQLALLSRNGDYYKVLHAGEHLLPWLNTPEVLLITLDGSEVPDVLADYLRRFQPEWVERYCVVADLSETGSRGVVYGRYFAGDPAAINASFVLACRG